MDKDYLLLKMALRLLRFEHGHWSREMQNGNVDMVSAEARVNRLRNIITSIENTLNRNPINAQDVDSQLEALAAADDIFVD